jgi:hypothetical protein
MPPFFEKHGVILEARDDGALELMSINTAVLGKAAALELGDELRRWATRPPPVKLVGEPFKCPRRAELGNPSVFKLPENDGWREDGTCSYCGSMRPEKAARARRGRQRSSTPTDKSYKLYVTGAPGGAKFYFQHFDEAQRRKFVELLNAKKLNLAYAGALLRAALLREEGPVRLLAIAAMLTLACAHAPATVRASSGPVCQGLDFPADTPCLEAGEKTPHAGLLVTPEWAREDLAHRKGLEAENASLKRAVVVDAGLVGGAVALILAAAVAGYELGHSVH